MKRFLCLFTALALLAALGLTAAGLTLGGAEDDIVLTEERLYGSPAAVSDVTVTARTQYEQRLFWTTTYPLGRPEAAVTEFLCRPEGISNEYEGDWNLDIYAGVNSSASGRYESLDDLPASYPIRLIAAVAERTDPGETREETLSLRDYYEVYPLDIYCRFAYGNDGEHHTLVACREIVEELFGFLSLQLHIKGHNCGEVVVCVLSALPVRDIRFNTEKSAFCFSHSLVCGYGNDVNGEHHIAVKVSQLRYHIVFDVGIIVLEKQHAAEAVTEDCNTVSN